MIQGLELALRISALVCRNSKSARERQRAKNMYDEAYKLAITNFNLNGELPLLLVSDGYQVKRKH